MSTTYDASPKAAGLEPIAAPPVPHYLDQVYWWAYVHPNAVKLFEREWLVSAILFGYYTRLRDAALANLGQTVRGRTLQMACVYGNLTPHLIERLAPDARLDVIDILPVQLHNLTRKLEPDPRVNLSLCDASALTAPDARYDQVLMFFLLHEMPEAVRLEAVAEAVRVLKPGGRLVLVDYHRPVRWHPVTPLMRLVFRHLEPFAFALCEHEIEDFLPATARIARIERQHFFGGLYQSLVLTKA